MRVVGYVRVSKARRGREQDPYTIAIQRRTIEQWCEMNGHELVGVESEVISAKTAQRPGFEQARAALEAGEADLLVAGKLDRISRSSLDFAQLVAQSRQESWAIAVLDIGVDTSTPNGRLIAGLLAQVAEWERELISLRTTEALAQARLEGVKLGRPSKVPVEVVASSSGEDEPAGASLGSRQS